MYLTDKLSEGLSRFESYNNKEIYRFDSTGFAVTGRLISGLSGFLIIVIMLVFTFSSAANSIMVSDIGGSRLFVGDVVVLEEESTSSPVGSLSPGQSVDFGYLVEDIEWNYNDNVRLSHVEVIVVWESNGNSVGSRSVTLDTSTQNGNTSDTTNDNGFGDTLTLQLAFNMLPETVSGAADTPEDLVESYEREGEWVGGTFTYNSGSTITDDNSINYAISLKVYTWDIQNIREVSEV